MKIKRAKLKKSFKFYILIYSLFIFILPNDFFQSTSLYIFTTPNSINYKWNDFFLSFLYLPVILYALYIELKRHKYIKYRLPLFSFLIVCFIKDIIYNYFSNNFIIANNSYEYYVEFFVAICFMVVFYENSDNSHGLINLFLVFCYLNLITLFFGVLIGHVAISGEYAFRFTACNLNQNSSGYLFFLGYSYELLGNKKNKKILCIILFIGILLTGNRSSMLYVILFTCFYMIIHYKKTIYMFFKKNYIILVAFVIIVLSIILSNYTGSNRFVEMIEGISNQGIISYILTDASSGVSRVKGLYVGIQAIKENFIFGTGLSCYSCQYIWTILKGTSAFPHFDWICIWLMFGILSIFIFYIIIKSSKILIEHKNTYCLVGIFLIVRFLLDGGLYQNFKNIFFIICNLAIIYYKSYEVKNERNINYNCELQHIRISNKLY